MGLVLGAQSELLDTQQGRDGPRQRIGHLRVRLGVGVGRGVGLG